MSQQTVRRPFDVAHLDEHFGRTQWTRLGISGDPNWLPRGGGSANGILSMIKG
jgi:hypothetical protein